MPLPNQVGEKRAASGSQTIAKKKAKATWSSNETYKTHPKTLKNVLPGIEYQLHLLMLFVVTSKSKFKLATEMADAEKFDDLVCCSFDNDDKRIFRFLQAKHSQTPGVGTAKITFNDLDSESGDFSIKKYLESYLHIIVCESFSTGELKDFILCTNIDFDFGKGGRKLKSSNLLQKNWFEEVGDSNDDFLGVTDTRHSDDDDSEDDNSNKRYKFTSNPVIRKDIIEKLDLVSVRARIRNKIRFAENLNNFFDKLTFAVDQSSGKYLKNRIKHELRKTFKSQVEVDFAYGVLFEYVFDWMLHRKKDISVKGSGSAHFMESSNITNFFDKLKTNYASLAVDGVNLSYTLEIEKSGIRFRDDIKVIQKIKDFLSLSEKNQFLIVSSTSSLCSVIKIIQVVEHYKKQCIFSDPKALKLRSGTEIDPMSAYSSKEKRILILVWISSSNPIDGELLNKFVEVTKTERKKRIVLITHPDHESNLKNIFKEDYSFLFDINQLSDLTYESQKLIWDAEVISPTRGKVKLSNLGKKDDDSGFYINGKTLCTVIEAVIYGKEIFVDRDIDHKFDAHNDFSMNQLVEQKMCKIEHSIDNFMINAVVLKKTDDYDEQCHNDEFEESYQLQALQLFALSDCDFSLGLEIVDYDNSHIVYSYRTDVHWKCRFVQTIPQYHKYVIKRSDLSSDVSPFQLFKHFCSYKKLQRKYRAVSDYVICTNIDFSFNNIEMMCEQNLEKDLRLKKYFRPVTVSDDSDILKVAGTNYKFTKDPNLLTELTNSLIMQLIDKRIFKIRQNKSYIKDFLKKLLFVVNCDNLTSVSEGLLSEKIHFTNKLIFDKFSRFILTWMQDYTKSPEQRAEGIKCKLDKEDVDRYLKKATNYVCNPNVENSTILSVIITRCGLRCKDENATVAQIRKFLKSKGKKVLLLSTDIMQLTEMKVLQSLSWRTKNKHTMFLNISALLTSAADSVEAFRATSNKYLIITRIRSVENDVDELINSFYVEAKQHRSKRLILITDPNHLDYIRCLFDEHNMELIEDRCNTFNELDANSKIALLRTKINTFRETKTLGDLLTNKSSFNSMEGDALLDLINVSNTGKAIETGQRIHDFDSATYVDISRTLTFSRHFLNKECLKINSDDIFVVSVRDIADCAMFMPEEKSYTTFCNENESFELNCQIVVVIAESEFDTKKCFNAVCKESKGLYVHLIEFDDAKLKWKLSWPSFATIHHFMIEEVSSSHMEIENLPDCSVIIGKRGSGKTTAITKYLLDKPFLWSFRIELKNYEDRMIDANFDDLRSVVEFLLQSINPGKRTNILSRTLLEHSLNQDQHVAVFLDDYDDVCVYVQKKVVELVNTLKITHCKVIVTGHCVSSSLAINLGILYASLNDLSNKDLVVFFRTFWTSRGCCDQNKIYMFSNLLNEQLKDLKLGSIHARMLSEIYQHECIRYSQSVLFKPEIVISNIWEIHKRYIDTQYQLRSKIFGQKFSFASLSKTYTKAYGKLALESLFPSAPRELIGEQKLTLDDLEEVGFIKKLENNKIEFIHRSHAEFFAADLLVEALSNGSDKSKYQAVKKFLLDNIFRYKNASIRQFVTEKINKMDNIVLLTEWVGIKDCVLVNGSPDVLRFQGSYPQRCREFHQAENVKEIIDPELPYTERIKIIFNHLLERNGQSLHIKVNTMSSYEYYCFDEVKRLSTKLNNRSLFSELSENCLKVIVDDNCFVELKSILNKFLRSEKLKRTNPNRIQPLVNLLIPSKLESFQQLLQLNNICFYLYTFHANIIADVENHIKLNHLKYARTIFKSFDDFNSEERYAYFLLHLRRFYNNIMYKPQVANITKSLLSDMYLEKDDCVWQVRQGVLILALFEIVNETILQFFDSDREGDLNCMKLNAYRMLHRLTEGHIKNVINNVNILPHVDHVSLISLMSKFTNDLSLHAFHNLLILANEIIVNDQTDNFSRINTLMPHLVIIIKQAGMHIIDHDNELCVFDPAGDFEYRFSASLPHIEKAKEVLDKLRRSWLVSNQDDEDTIENDVLVHCRNRTILFLSEYLHQF